MIWLLFQKTKGSRFSFQKSWDRNTHTYIYILTVCIVCHKTQNIKCPRKKRPAAVYPTHFKQKTCGSMTYNHLVNVYDLSTRWVAEAEASVNQLPGESGNQDTLQKLCNSYQRLVFIWHRVGQRRRDVVCNFKNCRSTPLTYLYVVSCVFASLCGNISQVNIKLEAARGNQVQARE